MDNIAERAFFKEANEINQTLKRIEKLLKEKEDNRSIHEHRIGALRRISEAVEYINKEQKEWLSITPTPPLQKTKDILLGTGGD